jgi:hypothetical protein
MVNDNDIDAGALQHGNSFNSGDPCIDGDEECDAFRDPLLCDCCTESVPITHTVWKAYEGLYVAAPEIPYHLCRSGYAITVIVSKYPHVFFLLYSIPYALYGSLQIRWAGLDDAVSIPLARASTRTNATAVEEAERSSDPGRITHRLPVRESFSCTAEH